MKTPASRFHVRMLCDAGHVRLVATAGSMYYERVQHVITWRTEYTREDAEAACVGLVDGRWVSEVWIEEEA